MLHMYGRRRMVGHWERGEVQEPPLGYLPYLQRNGQSVMSDRLQCPDCDGTGRQVIGSLQLACRFCLGRGYVGGDNEPAEEREAPPMESVRPVWEEPAVRILTVCRVCFGARKVVNLGGTGEPTGYMIEMPCPACAKRTNEDQQI